jgi:hypothetical protein
MRRWSNVAPTTICGRRPSQTPSRPRPIGKAKSAEKIGLTTADIQKASLAANETSPAPFRVERATCIHASATLSTPPATMTRTKSWAPKAESSTRPVHHGAETHAQTTTAIVRPSVIRRPRRYSLTMSPNASAPVARDEMTLAATANPSAGASCR